jgi:hypothetical protein
LIVINLAPYVSTLRGSSFYVFFHLVNKKESKKLMYDMTPQQIEAEKQLLKQGFKFLNWIDAQNENEKQGCMVMAKKGATKYGKEYREIDPEGNIN